MLSRFTMVRPTITLAIFPKLYLDEYPFPPLSLWSFIAITDSGALEGRCWWFKRHSLPDVCTAMSASRFAHSRCSRNFFGIQGSILRRQAVLDCFL
ncbi:Pogo transposable element with ZNF domain protein [Fusarium oxysporum f. sp. albedinis]|nr:Pogo transposable element with ZNF domain protein [Fusarium oxysporum f. sp. albedinis]